MPGKEARCVEVSGVTAYVPSGRLDLDQPVVIVDNGGPGVDPLAAAAGQPLTSTANTLVVLEPWVRASVSHRCAGALDQYVTSVRERGDRELRRSAAAFTSRCAGPLEAERRFTLDAVGTLIEGLRARGVPRVVVLAVSFGAERVATAAARADAVVLVAPYVGGRLQADLARRARAAEDALDFGATESALVARVRRQLPVRVRRRSVPFTAVDLDAAIIASAYDPAPAAHLLREDLARLARALDSRRPELPELSWLTTAADHVEGRYGRQRYFRGLIGYFGGFCSVQTERKLAGRAADSFLGRFHWACALIGMPAARAVPVTARGCSVDTVHDPVASSPAAVRKRYPRLGHIAGSGRGHVTGSDLTRGASMAAALAAGEDVSC